jgi:hypothetical protein
MLKPMYVRTAAQCQTLSYTRVSKPGIIDGEWRIAIAGSLLE